MTYVYEAHNFKPFSKRHSYLVLCKKCGLVYSNNRITQWCVRMGCNAQEHPAYRDELHKSSTK